VIALRALLLLPCSAALALALGAADGSLAPSAARLIVIASVALCALWLRPAMPGRSRSAAALAHLLGWPLAAAAVAALLLLALGRPARPLSAAGQACAVLALMLWPVLACAALVQRGADRAAPPWAATLCFVLLAALPLWAGPLAELAQARHPGAPDAVAATSPLVHAAVAAGNDLLRNEWPYRYANLASLPVADPLLGPLAAAYALLGLLASAGLLAALRAEALPPDLKESSR
jgi:hypothetical protein